MPLTRPASAGAALALALSLVGRAAPAGAAADHRLERDVVPTAQSLDLRVDPADSLYEGTTTVQLQVRRAVEGFSLHARDLDIRRLELEDAAGKVPTRWGLMPDGRLQVEARRPLVPGPAGLFVSFANDFDTHDNALYRFHHDGRAYVASQFEAVAAREAFPCWDEPAFKIPWTITLRGPAGQMQVSNTAPAATRTHGAVQETRFRTTRPLPAYLLAIAVGPWEARPVPGVSTPTRVITVRGAARLAGECAREVAKLLPELERWFGRRQPYDKLDLVAVPGFLAGGMENAGAILLLDSDVLHAPGRLSPGDRLDMARLLAHEMAHLWFGDSVTLEWWNDLWLNESFATFLADEIVPRVHPGARALAERVRDVQDAYARDGTASTRAIRAPFDSRDNPDLLFDEIAYDKGAAVLGMLQGAIGRDAFRAGLRDYLARHADGVATADDLWSALAVHTPVDVRRVARGFAEQPGVPHVRATLAPDGRSLSLRVERWRPAGAPPGEGAWAVPVVALAGSAAGFDTLRVVLVSPETTLALPRAAAWVHPNLDERGYYRWSLDARARGALLADAERLSPEAQAGLPPALGAMLRAGTLDGREWIDALRTLGRTPRPPALARALADAAVDLRATFGSPANADRVAATVRAIVGPSARALAFAPRAGEPPAAAAVRRDVWRAFGDAGRDTTADARGRTWTRALLAGAGGPPADVEDLALEAAAWRGDAELWNVVHAALVREPDPARRERLAAALGSFRDPALVDRSLALLADPALTTADVQAVLDAIGRDPSHGDRLFAGVGRAWTSLRARWPDYLLASAPKWAGGGSRERWAAALAFFAAPEHRVNGTDDELARVGAAVDACATLREREGARVDAALSAATPR